MRAKAAERQRASPLAQRRAAQAEKRNKSPRRAGGAIRRPDRNPPAEAAAALPEALPDYAGEQRKLSGMLGELSARTRWLWGEAGKHANRREVEAIRQHILKESELAQRWLVEQFRQQCTSLNRKQREAQRPEPQPRRPWEPTPCPA